LEGGEIGKKERERNGGEGEEKSPDEKKKKFRQNMQHLAKVVKDRGGKLKRHGARKSGHDGMDIDEWTEVNGQTGKNSARKGEKPLV